MSWLGSELMEAACFHIDVSGGSFRRLAGSGDGRCSIGVGRASDNIVEAIVVLVVASSGCIGGCVEVVTRLVVASSGWGCIEAGVTYHNATCRAAFYRPRVRCVEAA